MRRLFWVAAGAAAGVYAVRRVQRAAQSLTPQGVAGSLGAAVGELADAVREFAAEVRAGMAEREIELREALGLGDDEPSGPPTGDPHGDAARR